MFRIIITEITTETVTRPREWVRQTDNKDVEAQYGYAPEIHEQKEISRLRYEQLLDELDMASIVAVINRPNKEGV